MHGRSQLWGLIAWALSGCADSYPAKLDLASHDWATQPDFAANCTDGMTNEDETDVDCGGRRCGGCADGKVCELARDCASGACLQGVCGQAFFQEQLFPGANNRYVALADLDGDGWIDAGVTTAMTEMFLFVNQRTGFNLLQLDDAMRVPPYGFVGIGAGDFRGDGGSEFVVSFVSDGTGMYRYAIIGYANRAPGIVLDQTSAPDNGGSEQIVVADLNNDGISDFIMEHSTYSTIEMSRAPLQFVAEDGLAFGNPYAALDVDQDGWVDQVRFESLGPPGSLYWFEPMTRAMGPTSMIDGSPNRGISWDLDGDSWPDLAMTSGKTNEVLLARNDHQGRFDSSPTIHVPCGNDPVTLAAGDMNGDGRRDLIVVNQGDGGADPGEIAILYQRADGGFDRASFAAGLQPSDVAVADFDKNGTLDLVVVSDAVRFWYFNP